MCFEHFCVKRLPDRQRQTSFLQQLLRKNRPSHHPEILTAAAGLIYCSNQLHKTTFSFYICKLLQAISQKLNPQLWQHLLYSKTFYCIYNFFWLNCVICITEFWQRHFRKYLIHLRTLLLGGVVGWVEVWYQWQTAKLRIILIEASMIHLLGKIILSKNCLPNSILCVVSIRC